MTVWEYYKSRDEGELDALGREGWELVSALHDAANEGVVFYFKRPALDFREAVTLDQKRRYYKIMGIGISSNSEGHEV